MIQRLDRDTSGLIVFSIHPQAHAGLTKAFTAREARKTYLALVTGSMSGEGEFRSLLARSRRITSYNVCYTKLLRTVIRVMLAQGGQGAKMKGDRNGFWAGQR